MKLTKSARVALASRLREHTPADLVAMVEWVTGCRCGARTCRACSHLQPGGFANPQTYLRPDNCATYIDLATQAAAKAAAPEAIPATVTNDPRRAWAIVRDLCGSRFDRREVAGDDKRHTLTIKSAIKAMGGREAIADNLHRAEAAWPTAWAAACTEIARKLEAVR